MVRSILLSGVGRGISCSSQKLVCTPVPLIKWACSSGRGVGVCLFSADRAWGSTISAAEECSPAVAKVDKVSDFSAHTVSDRALELFIKARFIKDAYEAFEESQEAAAAILASSNPFPTAKIVLCGWVSHVRYAQFAHIIASYLAIGSLLCDPPMATTVGEVYFQMY